MALSRAAERRAAQDVHLAPADPSTALIGYRTVTLIVIIVVLLLLFGGGGGYYAHRSYGLPGVGGVLGLIVVVLVVLWLFGGLSLGRV